eukprot:3586642-Pleurochrysis_carterae.AAC.1
MTWLFISALAHSTLCSLTLGSASGLHTVSAAPEAHALALAESAGAKGVRRESEAAFLSKTWLLSAAAPVHSSAAARTAFAPGPGPRRARLRLLGEVVTAREKGAAVTVGLPARALHQALGEPNLARVRVALHVVAQLPRLQLVEVDVAALDRPQQVHERRTLQLAHLVTRRRSRLKKHAEHDCDQFEPLKIT